MPDGFGPHLFILVTSTYKLRAEQAFSHIFRCELMPKSEPVSVCDLIKNSTAAVRKFSMATASLQCVVVIFCSN